MRAAFAKMLEKNPVQSSHIDFKAGGNGVPILTRASSQSTAGFQTMGLPSGDRPMPGGGANKTVLGAYRMGDQDGNGAASAIYANDIFSPIAPAGREYPERMFASVGNNVFQPEYDDRATIALLKRLGDQKSKAIEQQPFEDYVVEQKLARDIEDASRNASLSDLGTSRDILRNVAAIRRQQNEADFLRKMINGGSTVEAAQQEIQNVRNANAIQEARKIDDREYQAKTLIQRIAASRGITPMVREPLNQSQSIDSPQPSQAMSEAMGKPGQGFGTSALDTNRIVLPPGVNMRLSDSSQEAQDRQTAFSNLAAQGRLPIPDSGSYSLATLDAQERGQQIDTASEALASRLDMLRQRSTKIRLPLPAPVVGKDIIGTLYRSKGRSVGDSVLYSPETIQDMNPLQLLLAINWSVQRNPDGFNKLKTEVGKYTWGNAQKPSPNVIADLKKVAYALNNNSHDIRIPFSSASGSIKASSLVDTLNDIKTGMSTELRNEIEQGRKTLERELRSIDFSPSVNPPAPPPAPTAGEIAKAALPAAESSVESLFAQIPEPRITVPREAPAPRTLPKKAPKPKVRRTGLVDVRGERESLIATLKAEGIKVRANQSIKTLRKMVAEL